MYFNVSDIDEKDEVFYTTTMCLVGGGLSCNIVHYGPIEDIRVFSNMPYPIISYGKI